MDARERVGENRMLAPELGIDPQHVREQVSRVVVPLGERVLAELLQREGHEVLQRDLLADHQTDVGDCAPPASIRG